MFRTEEISAPEVTSQNAFDGDIYLGVFGGWDTAGINAKCKEVYDILCIPQDVPLFMEGELTYAYTHKNQTSIVTLLLRQFYHPISAFRITHTSNKSH